VAFYSEETYEKKTRPKKPKAAPKDKNADAMAQLLNASKSAAEVATATAQAIEASSNESSAQIQKLADALIVGLAAIGKGSNSTEPTPVRLKINRKDRLIDTIDVIPLIKKATKNV